MTAPQPGRDGEVCATPGCGHSASRHLASGRYYCYADRAFGKRCLCRGFRPSAPSEPPAEAQQDDGQAAVVALADALAMAADVDGDLDPAELLSWINDGGWYVGRQSDEFRAGFAAALAARPSADTETLPPVLLALAERWESEVTPRSFHPAGTQADGRSQALADAAGDLRAALDGEQRD